MRRGPVALCAASDLVLIAAGTLGVGGVVGHAPWLTRLFTAYYFIFFLVLMPFLGLREKPLPVPATISEPVLSGEAEQKA